jgi:predicted Fe-Mo cluster-binding NifX family protein
MKIAVAYQDGQICENFASCKCFAIYEYGEYVTDCTKVLIDSSERETQEAMAEFMKEQDVAAVIAGVMSGSAKAQLLAAGIVPVSGFCGDADTAADMLVTGQLPIEGAEGGCGGSCGSCGGCGSAEGGDCGCGCGGSCGC